MISSASSGVLIRLDAQTGTSVIAVSRAVTSAQAALYEMIWKRTLACQMNPAK